MRDLEEGQEIIPQEQLRHTFNTRALSRLSRLHYFISVVKQRSNMTW